MSENAGDGLALLDLPRDRIARLFASRDWIVTGARQISETPAIVQGVGEGFREVGRYERKGVSGPTAVYGA
jgi:hypothetical protein